MFLCLTISFGCVAEFVILRRPPDTGIIPQAGARAEGETLNSPVQHPVWGRQLVAGNARLGSAAGKAATHTGKTAERIGNEKFPI